MVHSLYIFNPEHDLCLANGDSNFVPPASAMEFGRDCDSVVSIIGGDAPVVVWGWNPVIKRRLLRLGVSQDFLPSNECLAEIKKLSHRRWAAQAGEFVRNRMSLCEALLAGKVCEFSSLSQIEDFLNLYGSAVLKAPWSGSGKGLRRVRKGAFSVYDSGWCRNIISSQGSVIAEREEKVVQDFGVLFHIGGNTVSFEGYSLFYTDNCAYKGNVLASDRYILDKLSSFVPAYVISDVVCCLKNFLEQNFLGRYNGFVGIDMFICQSDGVYKLVPCVEINVRMTMGLLARRYYDNYFSKLHSGSDGKYCLEVVFFRDPASLSLLLAEAEDILTDAVNARHYAIAVFRT